MWRHLCVALSNFFPATPVQPYFDRLVNKIITFDGATLTVRDKAQPQGTAISALTIHELKPLLNASDRLKIILTVPAVLVHSITIPKAAAADIENILETELNSLLPFPGKPLWKLKWQERPLEDAITAFVALVKPASLQGLLDVTKEVRATVIAVGVRLENLKEEVPTYCDAQGNSVVAHEERSWKSSTAIAAVFALLCVVWTWSHFETEMTAVLNDLRASQATLATQAKQDRLLIDQIKSQIDVDNGVGRLKNEHIQSVKIWGEINSLLPDAAWLQGFSRKGNDVLLEGYADTPEELIELLEKSELFVGAAFVNAVVQAPGASKQRFNIKITLQRPET